MDRATATRAYAGVLGRAALHIEPAGNLLRDPDGEAVAGGLKQSAPLDFVLERFALDLGPLDTASAWPSASASAAFERLWSRDVVGRSVAWAIV